MSDILLDSPPVTAPDAATDVFKNSGSFDGTQAPAPENRTQPLAKDPPAKVEAKIEPTNKTPLQKMGAIKKPEPEKVAEPVIEKNSGPTKEENFKLLRERAEKAEKELGVIKPEFEKIKPAYETTRQEFEALKAKGLNEEERQEFARLREMNAVEIMRQSPQYQEKLAVPIQKRINRIELVAKNAKLSPQSTSALIDAVDILDEFEREDAIRAIVKGEDLEPEKYQALASAAVSTALDLNDNWYPKVDAAEKQALDVQTAARTREQQQATEMSTKQQAELKKAHDEVYTQLGESLKPLFDEPDLAVEGTTLSEAMKNPAKASSPQEMAAQEQLAAAAPFMVELINRVLKKNFDLEQANKLRNGSAPNRTDGKTKIQDNKEAPLDAKEVFQGRGQNFMG